MSTELREIAFEDVQHYFVDFQKHSKCFELPPEEAEYVGVFKDASFVGYFILIGHDGEFIEINQGYLKREYRHSSIPKDSLKLLEYMCKKAGYTQIKLGTHNRFKAYINFMKDNGYSIEHVVFSKRI